MDCSTGTDIIDINKFHQEQENKKTGVGVLEAETFKDGDNIISSLVIKNYEDHIIVYNGTVGIVNGQVPCILLLDIKLYLDNDKNEYLVPNNMSPYGERIRIILPKKNTQGSTAAIAASIPIELFKNQKDIKRFSIAIPYYDSCEVTTKKWVRTEWIDFANVGGQAEGVNPSIATKTLKQYEQ